MDTEELARRLAAFDAVVSDGPYPAPEPGEWSAEVVLAHAAMVNRLVAMSVAAVLDGEPAAYSNRLAGNEALLGALVAESDGLASLKADVLRTGRILLRLADDLGAVAEAPIQTFIAEADIVHVDGAVPVHALIASTLGYHLGLHREQLAAIAGSGRAPALAGAAATAAPARSSSAAAA